MHIDPSQIPEGIYSARALQLLRALDPTPITPAFLAGSLAVTIGGVFRLYCVSELGEYWSWLLSIRQEHKLVTSGPYSLVRHPSYTGFLLQYIGLLVMYGEQGSWLRQSGILQLPLVNLLVVLCFLGFTVCAWMSISRPPVEDKMLQRALGKDWENWAKRVKYRLLPGVY
jgi:protein-S-isoprenylcysteine O-methyltransferase Ste14